MSRVRWRKPTLRRWIAPTTDSMLGAEMCFMVGSPRSGTTVLAEVLGHHPGIAQFYEPYFLWEWKTGPGDDDRLDASAATEETKAFLRHEFDRYLSKSGCQIVFEKTPVNSFRIPFIREVFPEARWLHLVRDGRDATVSIHREWRRRHDMVSSRNPLRLFGLARKMVTRQPYWRNRFQAVAYELRRRRSLLPASLMNKARWRGMAAWGPRFPGWYEALHEVNDLVEFNALQWRHCVEAVEADLAYVPDDRKLEIRYEDLVAQPEHVLSSIQRFMGLEPLSGLGTGLETRSVGQWRSELSDAEKERVGQLLDARLRDLGYIDGGDPGSNRA